MNLTHCLDAVPNFFGFFDISIAPPLLFYAYIPIFILSLLFGVLVLTKDNYSERSKFFFGINISFALWILLVLIQWTSINAEVVHLAWQLLLIPEISIFLFSVYFCYKFLNKKVLPKTFSFALAGFFLILSILLPTNLNIEAFDLVNCEGVIGIAWNYVYIFELFCLFVVGVLGYERFRNSDEKSEKVVSVLVSLGVILFLGIFWISNFFAEITKTYEFNLIGPVGMFLFLGFLTNVIIRFKTFNIKLFTSEVFVVLLWVLTGSLLFIQSIAIIHLVLIVTLVFMAIVGIVLIRSVKREIKQREHIQKLALDLEKANVRLKELDGLKSEFLSFASHQIRSPLTAIKGYTSMTLEGDFGTMSPEVEKAVKTIDSSAQSLIVIVNEFLDISRIEQGKMVYDFTDFDLSELAESVVSELRPNVEQKGLSFSFSKESGNYLIHADKGKIKQVIGNIVDNAIKYTPTGGINVHVKQNADQIRIEVKDTGLGIDEETISHLFSKFTRAKDAHKTNVTGTGLGLYVARQMIEAQKGKVWVESEGKGKGSVFIIEIPAK